MDKVDFQSRHSHSEAFKEQRVVIYDSDGLTTSRSNVGFSIVISLIVSKGDC